MHATGIFKSAGFVIVKNVIINCCIKNRGAATIFLNVKFDKFVITFRFAYIIDSVTLILFMVNLFVDTNTNLC